MIHSKYRVVKLLLNQSCLINEKDELGRTPLHIAVEKYVERNLSTKSHNPAIIYQLLHRGADVNASTRFGDTPLLQAIEHGSEILVRLFLRHDANVNYRKGVNGDNALHHAVRNSHRDIVQILLDAGAEVNSVTRKRRTALHLAASRAFCEKTVDLLIERGAIVNAEDYRGK